jgi:hypothetical protein
MSKFAMLASVMILAAGSSNCSSPAGAASEIVPSGLVAGSSDGATTFGTNAAGGQGKGKAGAPTIQGTIDVAMVVDNNGDGLPNWSDVIDFVVSPIVPNEYVLLNCYQGSTWVATSGGWAPGSYPFTLSGPGWTGGAAVCNVVLYTLDGNKGTTLATRDFDVAP